MPHNRPTFRPIGLTLLLSSAALTTPAFAQTSPPEEISHTQPSLAEAIKATKPIVDLRLRAEGASFENFDENAEALTFRARVGAETGAWNDTKVLIEFDYVTDLVDNYNSVLNGQVDFPVIADPEVSELNRFQLTNTSLPDTTVTIGRQRIIRDNSRFIGNVGWRQDEQTYDAINITNKSIEGLTLSASYVDKVNRIFGDGEGPSSFESDSWLLNAGYALPIDDVSVKLGGYAYLLDLSAAALSTDTIGAFVTAKSGAFSGRAEYASQSDAGDNPNDFTESYYLAEGTFAKNGFNTTLGYEVLTGDGTTGFSTPLATAHKFQGFADVFLGTPPDGVEDLYAKVGYKTKAVGPLPFINMFVVYHDFNANEGNANYGTEVDAVIATKIGKTGVLFKYANYNADALATDRSRYSLQLDYKF